MHSYYFDRPDLAERGHTDQLEGERGLDQRVRGHFGPNAEVVGQVRRRQPPSHPKRCRGRTRAVAMLCIFFVLMAGGGAAVLALHFWEGTPLTGLEHFWGDMPGDGVMDSIQGTASPQTLVKRAPVGDGTELKLVAEPTGEGLSTQDIYNKNVSSIVSIRGVGPQGTSLGTGIVLSENGYIITNHHVIAGSETVTVAKLDGNGSYDALLVGSDDQTDLAVLKVNAQGFVPAEFGDSSTLRVGDPAYAIGNPLGEELMGTMTDGIISYIDRVMSVDGYEMQLIQTSAALNSGNSGGALVNQYGQVIGVTTLKMSSSWNTIEGLGFAIPSRTTKDIVDELIATGHIGGRPTIGIVVGPTSHYAEDPSHVPVGLWVQRVEEKSDAYVKGLRAEDIIVEANGHPTPTIEVLNTQKEGLKVGDALDLKVYRRGEYMIFHVKLVEQYALKD